MLSIDQFSFKGKRALVRVDFNVPLNDKLEITDDTRIRAALKTIRKISADGGRVILMSHLGRPKGGPEPKYSMAPVAPHLAKLLNQPVLFAPACVGPDAHDVVNRMNDGDVALLENLRFHKEEEGGDEFFAGQLAELGDVYVNDAFGTAHRAHASTAVIARFFPMAKMFGYLMQEEVDALEKVMQRAEHPVTAIIGGSKVSSKIAILENLLGRVDNVVIGGGMAYTFFKALGGVVGNSLVEDDKLDVAKKLIEAAREKGVTILLPEDSVIADKFDNNATITTSESRGIPQGWMGLDIGKKSIADFRNCILKSRTILWNGPMGVFELSNFAAGTQAIAQTLTEATAAGAFTLVGGGDSVAAINQFSLAGKVSYVSTGGGAMLEALEGKVLPGIAAVRENS
ncbi:MAG: phosphoglycerate kinase [Flavobacteriales bacterium]|nr:phosphoglycerate kinase [Flavobacteriales bacterium]